MKFSKAIIGNRSELVRFEPSLDTLLAALSVLAMTCIYYLNFRFGYSEPLVFFGVFIFLGHMILSTVLPCYIVLIRNNERLTDLGIGWHNWKWSLLISVVVALLSYPKLAELLNGLPVRDVCLHLLFNALLLWEVLFLFSWLQTRFQKAFGRIPATLLTSLSFVCYHIGSLDPAVYPVLFASSLIFTIVFAMTNNILVLLPIAWAVSSGIGTLMGGYLGGADDVALYSGVVLIQVLIITAFHRTSITRRSQGTNRSKKQGALSN